MKRDTYPRYGDCRGPLPCAAPVALLRLPRPEPSSFLVLTTDAKPTPAVAVDCT